MFQIYIFTPLTSPPTHKLLQVPNAQTYVRFIRMLNIVMVAIIIDMMSGRYPA